MKPTQAVPVTQEMPEEGVVQRKRKWNPFMLVEIYRMMREGISNGDICKTLEVTPACYYRWMKQKPELRKVVELVAQEKKTQGTFPKYVYSRLSTHLQELWDRIEELENSSTGYAKIELLLSDHGQRVRQQLFLHALFMGGFNPSYAMAKVCISRKELEAWRADVEFAELVDEIQWHKGNFFEQRLVDLCSEGNSAAIIFANKCANKDRGYSNSLEVNHTGSVMHGVLDLTELMPYMTREQQEFLLLAVRRREEDRARRLTAPVRDITDQVAEEIAKAV